MTSSKTAQKLPETDSSAKFAHIQGFPVLRTWGALQNLMEGNTWGEYVGLKTALKI